MTYILFLKNNGTNEINENLYLNYFSACACIQTHTHTKGPWSLTCSFFPLTCCSCTLLILFPRNSEHKNGATFMKKRRYRCILIPSGFHIGCWLSFHTWNSLVSLTHMGVEVYLFFGPTERCKLPSLLSELTSSSVLGL